MSVKIPAKRFVCLEEGELDHIKLKIKGGILRKVNSFPSKDEYIEKFGETGFIKFKITIKNGYLHIEDPKVEHSKMRSYRDWSDERKEACKKRLEVFTSVNNWKDKMLRYIEPQQPEHTGLINTGCGDPSVLVIEQSKDMMIDMNRKRLKKFDNGEPYREV